jgi:hypothetical protein
VVSPDLSVQEKSIDLSCATDFCLWAPASPDSTIANTEGEEVAWCTIPGHGTRIIPDNAIQSAQLVKTNDYWMITGMIQQSNINIDSADFGGELDPGGQDLVCPCLRNSYIPSRAELLYSVATLSVA